MIEIAIKKKIKTYNGFDLLDVKSNFASRGITQVLGNSGAGKTTLLKILAGLLLPEEGYIRVDNETWLDTKANICLSPQKRQTGFVFQDYALFPNMTAEEHLRYGSVDEEYINELFRIGRLEKFKRHKPRQLSGGQQQRLAILRSVSTKPRILLMDEPFSALDNDLKGAIISDLKQLIRRLEMTCLVVTHQPFREGEFADFSFRVD